MTWYCPRCAYLNDNAWIRCANCGGSKVFQGPPPPTPPPQANPPPAQNPAPRYVPLGEETAKAVAAIPKIFGLPLRAMTGFLGRTPEERQKAVGAIGKGEQWATKRIENVSDAAWRAKQEALQRGYVENPSVANYIHWKEERVKAPLGTFRFGQASRLYHGVTLRLARTGLGGRMLRMGIEPELRDNIIKLVFFFGAGSFVYTVFNFQNLGIALILFGFMSVLPSEGKILAKQREIAYKRFDAKARNLRDDVVKIMRDEGEDAARAFLQGKNLSVGEANQILAEARNQVLSEYETQIAKRQLSRLKKLSEEE